MKRLGGYFKMNVIRIILSVILAIDCLGLIVLVLMQQSKATGLSGSIAGGAETFFGKNKGKSIESRMKKWTVICLVVLVIFSICFYILQLESIWA